MTTSRRADNERDIEAERRICLHQRCLMPLTTSGARWMDSRLGFDLGYTALTVDGVPLTAAALRWTIEIAPNARCRGQSRRLACQAKSNKNGVEVRRLR